MSETVRIVEVGPRDGLQNEALIVPTERKLKLLARLAETGLTDIEATSFVSPKWVPQLADAEAVASQLPTRQGLRWIALVPNEKGYERARAVGIGAVAVFTAASEAFNRKNINAGIEESLERFRPVLERARADRRVGPRLHLHRARLPLPRGGSGRGRGPRRAPSPRDGLR